jgi:hypothetical protein
MEFECCFGTFVLPVRWLREYPICRIDPMVAHWMYAVGVRRASGFVLVGIYLRILRSMTETRMLDNERRPNHLSGIPTEPFALSR